MIYKVLRSKQELGEATKNVGTMFLSNAGKYAQNNVFAQRKDGKYHYWTWKELVRDILKMSAFFSSHSLMPTDRVAIVTGNSYLRLVVEMAVICRGSVAVPIFAGYRPDVIADLVKFSEVKILVVEDESALTKADTASLPARVLLFRGDTAISIKGYGGRIYSVPEILQNQDDDFSEEEKAFREVPPDSTSMIMYTSGTSSRPKGVLLTHANFMTQQRALEILWKPKPGMRFLCYLPWHHSFGGLFERLFALHSGGCLAIDDSMGRNMDQLFENFREIRPHVYFSVPKVYQEISARVLSSKEAEKIFFHPELQFIFTAAAPLPLSTSTVFNSRGVPVVEGWGLTETSPCCTLTERSVDRQVGNVGFPIPGVEVKLAEENEILVRGPNVVKGYFKNPQATSLAFSADGWFKTGDVGQISEAGVKILSRKDRMVKLNSGEKLFPSVIEDNVKSHCKFVKHAYVFGEGLKRPCLLVFPNMELFSAKENMTSGLSSDEECRTPECTLALSECLGECLAKLNSGTSAHFERIQKALVVQKELTIENDELTPSFKVIPRAVQEKYKDYIQAAKDQSEIPKDAFWVEIKQTDRKQS